MSEPAPPPEHTNGAFNPDEQQKHNEPQLGPKAIRSSRAVTDAIRFEIDIGGADWARRLSLHGTFARGAIDYSDKDQWEGEIDKCYIEYGLARGELYVELKNASAPLHDRYNGSLAETYTAKSAVTRDRSENRSEKATFGFGVGLKFGWGRGRTDAQGFGREMLVEYARPTVTSTGADDHPIWQFESPDPARPLAGATPGADPPLATLIVTGEEPAAFATFVARTADLQFIRIVPYDEKDTELKKKLAVIGKRLPELMWNDTTKDERGRLILATSSIEYIR